VIRNVSGQLPEHKFLDDADSGGCADPDGCVFERQNHSVPGFRRVVQIGNPTRGQISDDIRIIELAAPVIGPC